MNVFQAQQKLQNSIATDLTTSVSGQSWTTMTVTFAFIGTGNHAVLDGRDASGKYLDPDMWTVFDLVSQLKQAMADPDKGAWFSFELALKASGKFRYQFNYDKRVFYNDAIFTPPASGPPYFPDDDEWREEFRRFPRAPQYLPEWAREIVGAGPVVEAERSALVERALAVTLVRPDAFADVLQGAGWSALWGRVDVTVREHLVDDFNRELLADYRDGGRGYDGFWQEIYGALTRSQPETGAADGSKGGLEAELVAVGRLEAGAGAEERAAAVEEVLIALIESQIRQRLDIS